ncbi:MAG TPA: plastocyanin/azurin family copper-binding protein [Candidatus Limnocylindrales bacterium]
MVVGAIAVVALSACSSTGGSTPAASSGSGGGGGAAACSVATSAGTVAAGIKNFAFDPATVTAKVGDTITWTNNDTAGHTVTLDAQSACDTGTIASGATGSLTFTAAGTYAFHCKIHSSMHGTITITG